MLLLVDTGINTRTAPNSNRSCNLTMDEPSVSRPLTVEGIQTTTGRREKAVDIGAPAQHAQPSRKGKRAWRKNVNITEIEAAVESMREEERLTG